MPDLIDCEDCSGDGCFFCDNTGQRCNHCGESPAVCRCDEEDGQD